jgi:methoxymalonate biosynthesis acyl carrier protein
MSLISQLNALFLDQLSIEVPGPDTDLIETGMMDSMKLVELLVQIEQQFGLRIELEQIEIDDLRSVRGIARMIGNAVPGAGANAVPIGASASVAIGNAASGVIADAANRMIDDAAPVAAAG